MGRKGDLANFVKILCAQYLFCHYDDVRFPLVCCEYHCLIKDCLGPVQGRIEEGGEN